MSVFDRLRAIFGEASEAPSEAPTPSEAPSPVGAETASGAPSQPRAPAGSSAHPALDAFRAAASEDEALARYRPLVSEVGEARAIDEARRLLERGPFPRLRVELARTLDARGDDDAVEAVLSRMPERDVPVAALLEAWSRRAEVLERRHDVEGAALLWERILARDVRYGNARERLERLRGTARSASADAGATVMADGALTRGRYRVTRELGRGGAGTVFLARDVGLDRDVALKVYHRRGRADRERLLHEARVPAALEHPGVVRILDVDPTLFAIAMELTDGSLKDADPRGELPRERLLARTRSMIATLSWIHARGVVHRDVKPSNLLVRGDRVVFTDFGIAARVGEAPALSGIEQGEGSAGYMPPEQRRGAPAAFTMDVHALGVSIAELFASDPSAPAPLLALAQAMRAPDPLARPSLEDALRAVERLA